MLRHWIWWSKQTWALRHDAMWFDGGYKYSGVPPKDEGTRFCWNIGNHPPNNRWFLNAKDHKLDLHHHKNFKFFFTWLSCLFHVHDSRNIITFATVTRWYRRSQWPRGLRCRSTSARLLRSWVRIPPRAWMFVCCECCVLIRKKKYCKIYKITKITLGSACNQNGHNKNC